MAIDTLQAGDPVPAGYHFVTKGYAYITRHCTLETAAANKRLFIVYDGSQRAGIACPKSIYNKVLADEKNSRGERADKRNSKLRKELVNADAMLRKLFPRFPKQADHHESVLQRAWTVGAGRVGRTTALSLQEKVRLAVQAIARHEYTEYDALLKEGKTREKARAAVQSKVRQLLDGWAGKSSVKKDKAVKLKVHPARDQETSRPIKLLAKSPVKPQPKSSSRSPVRRRALRRKRELAGNRKPRANE